MIDKKRKEGRKGCGNTMELLEYWTKQGRGGSVGGAGSTKAWKPNLKKEEAKGDRVNRCLIVICQSL